MILSDPTAVSKSRSACWYLASSASPSAVWSGMFIDSAKSTRLLSTRKTAKRMRIVSGTAELNLRTSWFPLRTIGEGVSSPLLFCILVMLSIELDVAELSSAKTSKWNLRNRCRLIPPVRWKDRRTLLPLHHRFVRLAREPRQQCLSRNLDIRTPPGCRGLGGGPCPDLSWAHKIYSDSDSRHVDALERNAEDYRTPKEVSPLRRHRNGPRCDGGWFDHRGGIP